MAATVVTLGLLDLLPTQNPSSGRKPFPTLLPPRCSLSRSPPAPLPRLLSPALPLLSEAPLLSSAATAAAAVAFSLPYFVDPHDALAVNGELGILEGRTAALVHPVVMGGLFFYTLWAGYLGWQWRRARTIQNEINELKKKAPVAAGADGGSPPAAPSPVEAKIEQLTEERKKLLKGNYRERHYNAGSILLGFGVLEAICGALDTWFRTGKLFPGPHLFGGAGITVLWALAASLAPAMQRGSETARSLHIALNTLNILLFILQIPTGIEIVLKVFEFTNWP
ncbi:hypothetical protein Cni_G03882 [Canna indica]|uniref:Uncharacterized protein n=1 Tax=Canna indica TaxID=4628 RepID=A0AAQ3Q1S1_9LILI|nr:hypothetical protein Cni_G03882 [Canna indica]